MTTLIYDSSSKIGHQVDYIMHLVAYIKQSRFLYPNNYIFVLSPVIVSHLKNPIDSENIKVITITDVVMNSLLEPVNFLNKYKNSSIEGEYLKMILLNFNVNKIFFMFLDRHIVLASRSRFYPLHIGIFGIYFRPLPSLINNELKYIPKIVHSIKKLAKAYTLKLLISSSNIKKIYVSEDIDLTEWLNQYVLRDRFFYLPDPVDQQIATSMNSWRDLYSIGSSSVVYLIFGVMGVRKNIINCINAYKIMLSNNSTTHSKLLIVGKFESEAYKEVVLDLVNSDLILRSHVIIDDRFVNNYEREQLFAGCQVVLMPYLNFQGASGVLLHSVKYLKPVVVSNTGVVMKLVNNYNLGYCVSPSSINDIADAMIKSLAFKSDDKLNKEFLNSHSYTNFARTLLD